MPLIVAAVVLLAVLVLSVLLLPISIVQRYRVGTRRRPARGWLIGLNLLGVGTSIGLFLLSSALISAWLPGAFRYAVLGLAAGAVLAVFGLWLTRWEPSTGALHYTPPWPLVLAISVLIAGRVMFGLWRGWHSWGASPDTTSWLQQSGATGSLAAGAAVLGYYFTYWAGVRRRLRRLPPVRRIPSR